MKKLFLIFFAPLFLSACVRYIDGYNSDPYIVSTLSAYSGQKIRVMDFDSALGEGYASPCRGYNVIIKAGKGGLVRYIQDAFISELELAGLYSPDSSTLLKGTVTQIALETLTYGNWTIKMTLLSSNGRSLSVSEHFPFRASIAGQSACQVASEMYPYAVRNLIRKLVTSPSFKLLLGPSGYPKAPPPDSWGITPSATEQEEPVETPQPIPQMQIQPAPAKRYRKTETMETVQTLPVSDKNRSELTKNQPRSVKKTIKRNSKKRPSRKK